VLDRGWRRLDFCHIFQLLILFDGNLTCHEQYRTPPQLVGTVGFPPLPTLLTASPCSVNFCANVLARVTAFANVWLQQDSHVFSRSQLHGVPRCLSHPSTPTPACTVDHHDQPEIFTLHPETEISAEHQMPLSPLPFF